MDLAEHLRWRNQKGQGWGITPMPVRAVRRESVGEVGGVRPGIRQVNEGAVIEAYRPAADDAGDDDGQQRLELDGWTCCCGSYTEIPVRVG